MSEFELRKNPETGQVFFFEQGAKDWREVQAQKNPDTGEVFIYGAGDAEWRNLGQYGAAVAPDAPQPTGQFDAPTMGSAPAVMEQPAAIMGQAAPVDPMAQISKAMAPVPVEPNIDTTDDARAARSFSRTAYMDGLVPSTGVPADTGANIGTVQEQLARMMQVEQQAENPPAPEYNPEGTAAGRAFERGVLRTKAGLPSIAAQKDATVLADAQKTPGDLIGQVFLETTRLPEMPEGIDVSTPEKASASMADLGYPASFVNTFRQTYDIRQQAADGARGQEGQIFNRAVGNVQAAKSINDEAAAIPGWAPAEKFKAVLAETPDDTKSVLKAYASNPLTAAAFLADTAMESAPQIAAAGAAGLLTRSPAIGAAVMGGGSIAQEYGPSVAEYFQEAGVDPSNKEQAEALIRDPEFMAEASRRGIGRGVIIGLAEMAGQGAALAQVFKTATKEAVKDVGAQAVTGGGGEALARAGTGQEMSAKEIITEALAEGVTAPAEVGPAIFEDRRAKAAAEAGGQSTPPVTDVIPPQVPPAAPQPTSEATATPAALPEQAPATPPVTPDPPPVEANQGAGKAEPTPPPEQPQALPASAPEAQPTPEDAQDGDFEIIDEAETVDGETKPTGRKLRMNLKTGAVSPVEDGDTPAPVPTDATQSQPLEDAPAVGADAAVAAGREGDERPEPSRVFLNNEETLAIQTDPTAFQYKGGGDTEGVTDRLQGVKRFDPIKSGQVIIYERADGTRVIADGHQRTGLARRAAAAGQKDVGGMAAVIYREADGYTPQDVMVEAALKNIAEGSGTATDAARVMRNSTQSVEEMGLPPKSALVRDADGLRKLSDDGFGMVVNGTGTEANGAIVGRVVSDKALHADVIKLLDELKPANMMQAEMIARDAAADSTEQTQDSLFGDMPDQKKTLYKERAKILDGSIKWIRKNKSLFSTLVNQQNAITSAGNQLDTKANSQNLDDDAKMLAYLQSQANKKGEISDALTRSAEALANGESVGNARKQFTDAVRGIVLSGGEARTAAPQGRRDNPADGGNVPEARPELAPQAEVTPAPAPQTERTPEGEQTLMPGVAPISDRARLEAQMNKPKSGTDSGPRDGRNDLFGDEGDRGDLFDAPAPAAKPATTGADLMARGKTLVEPYKNSTDGTPKNLIDLMGTEKGATLADKLAATNDVAERYKIADAWVLEKGKAGGAEHLVVLSADGIPLAIAQGSKSAVSVSDAVVRYVMDGNPSYTTHNHPIGKSFSVDDMNMAAHGFTPIIAMGHNGDRHEMSYTDAGLKLSAETVRKTHRAITLRLRKLAQAKYEAVAKAAGNNDQHEAYNMMYDSIIALTFQRMGVTNYSGDAQASLDAVGAKLDEYYPQLETAAARVLGPAGFNVAAQRDSGSNRNAGRDGADAGSSRATGDATRGSGDSNRAGRSGANVAPETTGDADFDGMLDDLLGPEDDGKEALRSKPLAVTASSQYTFNRWRQNATTTGTARGWRIFHDDNVGDLWSLRSASKTVSPFRTEAEARAWADLNPEKDTEVGSQGRKAPKPYPLTEESFGGDPIEFLKALTDGQALGLAKAMGVPVKSGADARAAMDNNMPPFRDARRAVRDWIEAGMPEASPRAAPKAKPSAKPARSKAEIAKDLGGLFSEPGSPQFDKWFGDSKAVGKDGMPLVVYHGAPDVRDILKDGFRPSYTRGDVYFMSDSPSVANTYADDRRAFDYENAEPQVIPLYVSLQNPLVVDAKGAKWRQTEARIEEARDGGHDGLIIKNSRDEYNNTGNGGQMSTVFAVFNPSQMKSAMTGPLRSRIDGADIGGGPNNGEYSAETPNILREGVDVLNSEKYETAVPLFQEALRGAGADTMSKREVFTAMARPLVEAGLDRAALVKMKPYFDKFLEDVDQGLLTIDGEGDATGGRDSLERDSGDAGTSDNMGAADVPVAGGRSGRGAGAGAGAADGRGGRSADSGGVPAGNAADLGGARDQGVSGRDGPESSAAADRDGAGSGATRKSGLSNDNQADNETALHATDRADLRDRQAAQAKADRAKVKFNDEANIADTLPLLMPEQRDDVVLIERRFAKDDGHGMLITNGTGTGKTYSGGGVIKRMVQAGKDNILIVAPDDGIMNAWIAMGADMGIPMSKLRDTKDAGQGVVVTTYANMGVNNALASRDWDLVVTDEAHKLSQNANGDSTKALTALRAISNRPDDLWMRSHMLHADEWAAVQDMKDADQRSAAFSRLRTQQDAEVAKFQKQPRAKVLFLSATPFSYDKTLDYAEGYLFNYGASGTTESGSRQDGRAFFFVQNFGYRIRYHKLTKPEGAVDNAVFEREMHERLKASGALAGRSLTVSTDYDRKFVAKRSELGDAIDGAFEYFSKNRPKGDTPAAKSAQSGMDEVQKAINANFKHHQRMQLLEAIKAEAAVDDIRAHLAMGRKVVLFHDFNKGGGQNPFNVRSDLRTDEGLAAYDKFLAANPAIAKADFGKMRSPLQTMQAEFAGQVAFYNGTEKKADRAAAITRFNDDSSKTNLIVVQADAGSAGISLHDTTGNKQRVLINLGMPPKPTTALQEEGRIRRVGVKTDAAFRYYTIGTTWERAAFADKIAGRSGTVENLALGNEARAIRDSFIDAYAEAEENAPSAEDGKGGMERDRVDHKITPFDRAKTHYFGRLKSTAKRSQRQGKDFYATPEPLGYKMVEWAGMRANEKALEPSVGDGAIGRYFPEYVASTIIDPSNDLLTQARLRVTGAKAENVSFEDHHIVNKYDVVVMNPPFGTGGKMAYDHLQKAMGHVRPGGRVVALVPTGPAADKRFAKMVEDGGLDLTEWNFTADIMLPSVTFEKAGTSVAARVMIFDRVMKPEAMSDTKHINLTGMDSINGFFDRLEAIGVPARPDAIGEAGAIADADGEAQADGLIPMTKPPLRAVEGVPEFKLAKTWHAKQQRDTFVATADGRMEREAYLAVNAVAKANGGNYSSFRGNGAIPGFQFKTEDARQAFLDDVQRMGTSDGVAEGGDAIAKDQAAVQILAKDRTPQGVNASLMDPVIARQVMPALRAELDRLNLKRVRLGMDKSGKARQGAFEVNGLGQMDILIGAALDPMRTLHHEVVHSLKAMDLFTAEEWTALERAAAKGWVEKHDIPARYPNLLPIEQIEEAIAEEFAERAASKIGVKGVTVARAFAKIQRVLQAIRAAFGGKGYVTPESVFGDVMAGRVGARDAGNTGARLALEATEKDMALAPRNANTMMGQGAHIPDRKVWEEFSNSNASYMERMDETGGAIYDKVDRARIDWQDRFLPVLRAEQAVERATGVPLPEDQRAYLAEETYSGKVGRHLFEIDEESTKPIIALMAGKSGLFSRAKDGISKEEVGTFLYARHAKERNAQIASINMTMPDGGSGMTDAEADALMAQFQASPNWDRLQKIADLIDKLRERTLKLREDAGLITSKDATLWRNQYSAYVPLKGFADTDHSEAVLDVTGVGRRFNTRGQETKRALGRTTEAFNPLQAAITQAQETAVRAEKNRVGQALYNLAKENPSKALWEVKTPKMVRYYNKTTGLVETRVEDPRTLFMDPNEMAVKINGVEKRVIFKDERLAVAAGSVGADEMGSITRAVSMFGRYFSTINTMLNPVFTVTNGFRDMITAQITIGHFGGKDAGRIRVAMLKNWPKAWLAAYRGQLNKSDTEWTKYYKEFEEAGAKVAFWRIQQPEVGLKNFDRRINDIGGGAARRSLKYLRFSTEDNPILSVVERTNLAVDNAIRLAAYVEARRAGWSKLEAASLSKNMTVNFNRRGHKGAGLNAWYVFANAAIQGSHTLLRSMKSKQVRRIVLSVTVMSMLQDLVNAALSEEDDDGELAYDKIPMWKAQMNSMLMLSAFGGDAGKAATVPLPYGYNLFTFAGQQMGKIARGVKKPEDALRDTMLTGFTAFSPISGSTTYSMIMPTILDPVSEMAMNEDWLGRPIRPESPYNDYGPDAYKFYGGASTASKMIADGLNRATGGTIAESGMIDVSPEYIDHATGFLTGGAGRFLGQSGDLITKAVRGEWDDIEQYKIPFANRLYTDTGDFLDNNRYYKFREDVKEKLESVDLYKEAGKSVPDDIRKAKRLEDVLKGAEKVLRQQRIALRALDGNDNLTPDVKRERRKRITDAQHRQMMVFNKRYIQVMGVQGE